MLVISVHFVAPIQKNVLLLTARTLSELLYVRAVVPYERLWTKAYTFWHVYGKHRKITKLHTSTSKQMALPGLLQRVLAM